MNIYRIYCFKFIKYIGFDRETLLYSQVMVLKLSHFQYVEGDGGISLPNSIYDKQQLCSKFKIHISTTHPNFLIIY